MTTHRVVVTGLGAISTHGQGAHRLWQAAKSGVSGAAHVDFERVPQQKVMRAAPVLPEQLETDAVDHKPRMQDRVTLLALIAAAEAASQAGLDAGGLGDSTGVSIGSGFGGADSLDENYWRFSRQEGQRLDPLSVPKIMMNAAASWVSMRYGATGPVYCTSTACSSASQAIGLAYHMVRSGMVERCITGGSEACVVPGVFRVWELMRVLTADLCRPFSVDRNGMMLGEGAGVLVIETREAAEARGAEILAEIVGYGTSSDAGDLLRPDPVGAAKAMAQAVKAANIPASEIGYVNAHGTATVANDASETEAMREIFGDAFDATAISSTKPVHGHALGAAGALEAIVTISALRDGFAPPNLNFTDVDPKIGFTPVLGEARAVETRYAMSNSFAFGGINASLIFGKAP